MNQIPKFVCRTFFFHFSRSSLHLSFEFVPLASDTFFFVNWCSPLHLPLNYSMFAEIFMKLTALTLIFTFRLIFLFIYNEFHALVFLEGDEYLFYISVDCFTESLPDRVLSHCVNKSADDADISNIKCMCNTKPYVADGKTHA